ncbi:DUF3272 family protein [Streptococcus caprae]|uniref:DUF3272 family protein n=1 Tax=Streptococcus caprae TaxID=1640501 RepID=A0ABV8CY60_9STRE
MPIFQFIIMAVSSAFETIFMTEAFFAQEYLLVAFWGFFLYRNLRLAYRVDQFTNNVLKHLTKK